MITKNLLPDAVIEIPGQRTITVCVPSRFKDMIQQLIDDYAADYPMISANILELEGSDKDCLENLINMLMLEQLPDIILLEDTNLVKLVEYNSSAFLKFSGSHPAKPADQKPSTQTFFP